MGSFHGADIYDLVGLYILSKLGNVFSNCGLYRDNGLGVIDLEKPFVHGRTRKQVYRVMSDIVFKITLDPSRMAMYTIYISKVTLKIYRLKIVFKFEHKNSQLIFK